MYARNETRNMLRETNDRDVSSGMYKRGPQLRLVYYGHANGLVRQVLGPVGWAQLSKLALLLASFVALRPMMKLGCIKNPWI